MKFIEGICEALTRALGLSAISPWSHKTDLQQPVGPSQVEELPQAWETLFPASPVRGPSEADTPFHEQEDGISLQFEKLPGGQPPKVTLPPGPVFAPPNANPGFYCNYTDMRGWGHTAGAGRRGAWLAKPIGDDDSTGGIFDIFTNYDQYAPRGIVRKVGITLHLATAHP